MFRLINCSYCLLHKSIFVFIYAPIVRGVATLGSTKQIVAITSTTILCVERDVLRFVFVRRALINLQEHL